MVLLKVLDHKCVELVHESEIFLVMRDLQAYMYFH